MDQYQHFRLPGAVFPLDFEVHGKKYQLTALEVHGSGSWRCYIEGAGRWNVATKTGEAGLLASLRETGFAILARSPVGTIFRSLEEQGIAERVYQSDKDS